MSQKRIPFIAIRAISDLVGGSSSVEVYIFSSLAARNAIKVVLKFVSLLLREVQTLYSAQ